MDRRDNLHLKPLLRVLAHKYVTKFFRKVLVNIFKSIPKVIRLVTGARYVSNTDASI
jgi:hypothetical protein